MVEGAEWIESASNGGCIIDDVMVLQCTVSLASTRGRLFE